jgi:hypothetical protein
MPDAAAPWWRDTHTAAHLLASVLQAEATRARQEGRYQAPPGSRPSRRSRQPGSLRHFAEVIQTLRLAPGISVDKDIVAAVFAADLRYITDPVVVVAVAKAARLIADQTLSIEEEQRLRVGCARIAAMVEEAETADDQASRLVPAVRPTGDGPDSPAGQTTAADRGFAAIPAAAPGRPASTGTPIVIDGVAGRRVRFRRSWLLLAIVLVVLVALVGVAAAFVASREDAPDSAAPQPDAGCRLGASGNDIIDATAVFDDDRATRLTPTLDFDEMNGSARYDRYDGRTYYWGRAGSDDATPRSGGARIRWRPADGRWRSCPTVLPEHERGYVHTVAVATTIQGRAVTVQICLWRDRPYRENCTPPI